MTGDEKSGMGTSAGAGTGWAGQDSAGSGGTGSGGNPADQITRSLKTVSDALKSASERVASSSQEVGLCALKQAEQNTNALFDTLRAMASTKSPKEVGDLYTRFVSDAAKAQADQLREIGEILARTSREAWAPVTDALAQQRRQSPFES